MTLGELTAVCIDVTDKVRARKRKHVAYVRKRIGRGGQLDHVAERLQVGRHNILVVEVAAGILCGKLQLAHKIQRRCSAVGFDWTSLGPVLDKVHEEIDEVMHEAQQAVVDEAKLEEEVGDLLFATVNLSRHLGVKAEVALQKANRKFERRFREVERIVAARGLEMTGIDLDTMEEVWQEVKRQETDL